MHRVADSVRIAGNYIVAFKDTTTAQQVDSFVSDLESLHGVSIKHTYTEVFQGFSANLNKEQLMLVRTHPQVEIVEEDQVMSASQKGPCTAVYTDADWGLSRISSREIDTDGHYFYPPKGGTTVDVYIIDTGIYTAHTDFEGRATFGFKSDSSWPSTDDAGHGTHVASTVGGKLYGVAKSVNLIAVKVLGGDGSGSTAGVIAGVDWAVKRRKASGKNSVGNMSLGGGPSSLLNKAVNAASNAGVYMVVAAGNDNVDACGSSPASATDVICVGATDLGPGQKPAESQDVRAYFSNYGSCVDVFAPGTTILGAWIGGVDAKRSISGTSMAYPHVAGVAALFLDQHPGLKFANLRERVESVASLDMIDMECTASACTRSPNLMLFSGCEDAL
jgi:subtilisin family serine protease